MTSSERERENEHKIELEEGGGRVDRVVTYSHRHFGQYQGRRWSGKSSSESLACVLRRACACAHACACPRGGGVGVRGVREVDDVEVDCIVQRKCNTYI